jgi:hypothetical protein
MSQDYGQIIKWTVAGAVVVGVGYWLVNRDKNTGPGFLASIGNAIAKMMPTTYVVYDAQGNKTTRVLLPGETNPIVAKDAEIRNKTTPIGTPVDISKISISDRIFANLQGKTLPGDAGYNAAAADAIWSESATWYDTLVNSTQH